MPRILEELYYGNINPSAKQFIRNTSFDRTMRTISDSEAKLTELLTGKEKEIFLKMANASVGLTEQEMANTSSKASGWEQESSSM